MGCGGESSKQTAQCPREVPASTLVETEGGIVFPFIDGTVLAQGLNSAFSSGAFAPVPIIDGTNHDEWRLQVAQQYGDSLTDAGYPQAVADLEGGRSVTDPFVQDLVNTEYPLSNYPPPQGYSVSAPLALGALGTDEIFVCPARNADLAMAKYVPTYTYEFNDKNPPFFFQPQTFPLGDPHFVEVPYLFDFGLSFKPDQQQLSSTMIEYWTQFAKPAIQMSRGRPIGRHTPAQGEQLSRWFRQTQRQNRIRVLILTTSVRRFGTRFRNFKRPSELRPISRRVPLPARACMTVSTHPPHSGFT